jgi:hypothetical protein
VTYFQCPACEWDCVLKGLGPELVLGCPLCLEDNGRFVRLQGRPAVPEDRPEGFDDRDVIGYIDTATDDGVPVGRALPPTRGR